MSKPKFPKKTNGAQDTVSPASTPTPPITNNATTNQTPAEMTAATQVSQPETRKTQPKKNRKPEIVKSDSRSKLVPINMEDEVRRLAYLLSERRGFEPGHETEDWLAAEHEVLERYHQHTA